jgi:calcium/calmodulin-dependent protein kinase (CaM kinase) II/calcium/calmodulin-dependent protein kinase I
MAPEIINYQPYDQRADNWSLGVLVYTLIGGYNPFVAYTDHLTWQNIRQAKYQFHPQYWDGISRDAKSLIKGLLTRDPNQRLMVDQALSHPWMIGRGQDMMGNPINLKKLKEFNIERVRDSNVSSVSYFWLLTRR